MSACEGSKLLNQPLTISLLTSLLVSSIFGLASLIVAIRVGKEKSDRAILRGIYKSLFEHFREMGRKIEIGEPARWSDFPMQKDKYYPPVKELERTGDLNLLPKHLANDLLEVEKTVLTEAYHFRNHIVTVVGPLLKDLIEAKAINPLASAINGQPYISVTANLLAVGGERYAKQLRDRLGSRETKNMVIGIPNADKIEVRRVTSTGLKDGSIEEFVDAMLETATLGMGSYGDKLARSKDEIDRVLDILSKRIRDPHPFSETVRGIISDPFDQSSR